jgi:putative transposase
MSIAQKRPLLERDTPNLSIETQCNLLGVSRASIYYEPRGESAENLALMMAMDKLYTAHPYFGVERIQAHLPEPFSDVNVKRVRRLLRKMGIMAIYPPLNRQKTSSPNPEHEIFPYLLRGMPIEHPNQVWSTDITYVPMKDGFMYLCAVIDWYSRFVLSWTLSNTMDVLFCKQALQKALEQWGKPEIFNTDQGSQFTSKRFTQILKDHEIAISMDGKGRALDNVFVERLWRSVKYEDIYLRAYTNGLELYDGLEKYFYFYNHHRKHQALKYKTPAQVFKTFSNQNKDTKSSESKTITPTIHLENNNHSSLFLP